MNSDNSRPAETASTIPPKASQESNISPSPSSTKVESLAGTKYQAGKTFGIEFATADRAVLRGATFPPEGESATYKLLEQEGTQKLEITTKDGSEICDVQIDADKLVLGASNRPTVSHDKVDRFTLR